MQRVGLSATRSCTCERTILSQVRAHQCVTRGYEYFAGGHLITVFSATNSCGKCATLTARACGGAVPLRPRLHGGAARHSAPCTVTDPPAGSRV